MVNTTVTRRLEWDMGHRLEDHESKCRNLHGHRYAVELTLAGPVVTERGNSERGMVADFGRAKALLSTLLEEWDHGMMLSSTDPFLLVFKALPTKVITVEFAPTAENIASAIFKYASDKLYGSPVEVVTVTVWETPTCRATVSRDPYPREASNHNCDAYEKKAEGE
jgi:6-pyruvoyltetrahydropterin/6-carboxytetrahydropterin synthase